MVSLIEAYPLAASWQNSPGKHRPVPQHRFPEPQSTLGWRCSEGHRCSHGLWPHRMPARFIASNFLTADGPGGWTRRCCCRTCRASNAMMYQWLPSMRRDYSASGAGLLIHCPSPGFHCVLSMGSWQTGSRNWTMPFMTSEKVAGAVREVLVVHACHPCCRSFEDAIAGSKTVERRESGVLRQSKVRVMAV